MLYVIISLSVFYFCFLIRFSHLEYKKYKLFKKDLKNYIFDKKSIFDTFQLYCFPVFLLTLHWYLDRLEDITLSFVFVVITIRTLIACNDCEEVIKTLESPKN